MMLSPCGSVFGSVRPKRAPGVSRICHHGFAPGWSHLARSDPNWLLGLYAITISVRAIGIALVAFPALSTVRIGPGVTEMKTSGRMLPATIRLARPLEPCARPCMLAPSDFATAGFTPASIIEPIEPA